MTRSASGQIQWSSNGEYLVLNTPSDPSPAKYRDWLIGKAAEPEVSDASLMVWDVRRHKKQILWSYNPSAAKINSIHWLAGSAALVVDATVQENTERKQYVTLYDVDKGNSTLLYSANERNAVSVSVSPTRPIGALSYVGTDPKNGEQMLLVAFDSSGETGRATGMPVSNWSGLMAGFGPDGNGPYAYLIQKPANGEGSQLRTFAMTPGSDRLHEVESSKETMIGAPTPSSDIHLITGPVDEFGRATISVSLEGATQEPIVVARDAVDASLAPEGAALAYRHADNLIVREVVRPPIATWKHLMQGQNEEEIRDAFSAIQGFLKGYQAGNPRRFPDKAGWDKISAPLAQNAFIAKYFTYTYDGSAISDDASLRMTVIGVIRTESGTAQLHGDFKITWSE